MDIGLAIIRIFVGVAFAMHGTQKLFGWFGGYGVDGTAGFMGSLRYRNPRLAALGAGVVETGAGVLLVAGFLTPLAAAAVIGVMLNAVISAKRDAGFIGGYELDALYAFAALSVAFTGAGRYAVDASLRWDLAGTPWGLGALGLGAAIGAAVLASRAPAPAAEVTLAADERRAA